MAEKKKEETKKRKKKTDHGEEVRHGYNVEPAEEPVHGPSGKEIFKT